MLYKPNQHQIQIPEVHSRQLSYVKVQSSLINRTMINSQRLLTNSLKSKEL